MISSIPGCFDTSETLIICCKYSGPVRSTIFNFNKIVSDLNMDSITLDS